jgi:hypothetical protein
MTQYNAKDCTITANGVYITGLGEDMVTGKKDEEFFSTSVGAQGDVVMNETNNTLGTITVAVQGTSPQKGMLMDLAKAGTVFPIWATNKSIGERMGGTQARIKNYPELKQAAELDDREFEFQVFDYTVDSI